MPSNYCALPTILLLLVSLIVDVNAAELSRAEIKKLLGTPDVKTMPVPNNNADLKAEIALGKALFFDPLLSKDKTISCATCHNPKLGFGDGMAIGIGVAGNNLERNSPSLFNVGWNSSFFWDGRSKTLEQQALEPIRSKDEMGMKIEELSKRLRENDFYKKAFKKTYNDDRVTGKNIAKAIAQFERTIVSNNSAFDKYLTGDDKAMTALEMGGMQLFVGKANCVKCHSGPNFTDQKFHNIGVKTSDMGRFEFDDDENMEHAFKTPTLRNVTLTAPYMHNGAVRDLEQVIELYRAGGDAPTNDPDMGELDLSQQDVRALIAFMGALTDTNK